jgi:hypothetical protein
MGEREPLQPFQGRVVIEREDLHQKIERLAAFVTTPLYEKLDIKEKDRLQDQLIAMRKYESILDERIKAFR